MAAWYYLEAGKSQGPVDEEKLVELIQQGKVAPATLVWKDGMADWKPCSEAGPKVPGTAGLAAGPDTENCAQCGKAFKRDEMLRIENVWVCVDCKPIVLQKLKEGVQIGSSMVYGGFWLRFAAKIVDGILMQILNYAFIIPFFALVGTKSEGAFSLMAILPIVFIFFVQMAYTTFFVGKFGATPGKMACRLKIVNPDGSRISYGRAFGRYWGEMVSAFTLYIGYLMTAWDEEKRALHDRICNTRVIRTS